MCLVQGPQRSDAGEARTRGPRSRVKHSTTEPLHSLLCQVYVFYTVLIDFSLTVKAATLIFISGRGSASSSATEGKPGCIYNLVKNK